MLMQVPVESPEVIMKLLRLEMPDVNREKHALHCIFISYSSHMNGCCPGMACLTY